MVTINLNFNNFSELPILSEVFGSYGNSYEYTADEIFRKKASPFCPKCNSPMVHNGYNIYGKKELGLKNLTLTIKFVKNGLKNYIFANFDQINTLIITKMGTIP